MLSQLFIQRRLAVEVRIIFNHKLSFSFLFPLISVKTQISNEEKLPKIPIMSEL